MKILGVSFDYHDAAAALVIDGEIVAAETEERFSRRKHDADLPAAAMRCCLQAAGLQASDLDKVVFYENTYLKFDRILSQMSGKTPANQFNAVLQRWVTGDRFFPCRRLAMHLGIPEKLIMAVDHHRAHAASAYFASGFDEAVVVTLDGVGEYETASVSWGQAGHLRRLHAQRLPDSLGLFYSALTAFLGFEVNEGEYKVMGMAGFGQPRHQQELRGLFDLAPPRGFRLARDCFDFSPVSACPYTPALTRLLGTPRVPESPFDIHDPGATGVLSRHYADIAASAQAVTEGVILDYIGKALRAAGGRCRQVCLAGGVGLNSLANRRIQSELGVDLFVQPAAGDAGGALGAAYLGERAEVLARPHRPHTALYGRDTVAEEIEPLIRRSLRDRTQRFDDQTALVAAVADLIAAGKVVGWHQGRAEWGPRALGSRSILANPADPDIKDRVNRKVKFREPFRPFAPSVLTENAHEYFEVAEEVPAWHPENFMLSIAPVREAYRTRLPAITHVDGTARLQRVRRDTNPLYYALIAAVGARTGIPMVLNTSFNLRGEPMVGGPEDSLATFSFSDIDALAIGPFLIRKPQPEKLTSDN